MNSRCVALSVLACILAGPAHASAWTGLVHVSEVRKTANGAVVISVADPHGDPDSCGRGSDAIVASSSPDDMQARISILLTALATGLKVRLYLDGCSGDFPNATDIRIFRD